MMPRLKKFFSSERALYVLVAWFVLLGALYSVTTPIFEAGDELWHYPFVQWLARGNGLPVQDPTHKQLWEQEGGQPPLYYALAAASTFWIDTGDLPERLWRNPFAQIGVPLAFGNKNMVVHTRAEDFPWHGTTLAVHWIRFLSVLFSAGTVFLTYKAAREIFRPLSVAPSLALLAASLVAFNPMFLFISASVNNDSLAALLAACALFGSIRLVTRGISNQRVFVLGILVGLAILTKVSNLALGAVVGAVISYLARKQKSWRSFLIWCLVFAIPLGVLDAWWFARNYFLYGDATAFNVWLQIAGGRPPQTLLGLLNEFQGFRISFWGNFGGVNVIAPEWVYTTLDVFSLLAVIGLVIGLVRRKGSHKELLLPKLLWIPALHLAVVFVALLRWTLLTYASQGRLIFPALAAVAILLAFGLYEISTLLARWIAPSVLRRSPFVSYALPFLFALLLFCFALTAPFLLIAPVYAQPPRMFDQARVPNPVHITFDAGNAQPELVGFDAPRFVNGNALPLKLYWRTDAPINQDLKMYIHVYDARGNLLGQWDALPGNGLAPPRLWQPHEILVDEYRVPVKMPDVYPPLGRIEVGMARIGSANVLPAHNPQGETITPSLAQFKFVRPTPPLEPARVEMGDTFNLLNLSWRVQRDAQEISIAPNAQGALPLRAGDVLRVDAALQARKIPQENYTLFAHMTDAQGNIIAQRDAQPLDNAYPTTLWNANEQVTDTLVLEIPRDAPWGNYVLEFGVYRARDIERLPLNGENWDLFRVQSDHIIAPLQIEP